MRISTKNAPPNSLLSRVARWGALYLALQSLGAILWWLMLWLYPSSRAFFRPRNVPDSALFAFFLPDAILFIAVGIWAAIILWRAPKQALVPLALHVGAASYAALYCGQQWLMTGEAFLAALFMLPALIIGPLLLWICWRA